MARDERVTIRISSDGSQFYLLVTMRVPAGPAEPILDDQSDADSGMCGRTLLLTVEEAASLL
jgi:hypothetical protein